MVKCNIIKHSTKASRLIMDSFISNTNAGCTFQSVTQCRLCRTFVHHGPLGGIIQIFWRLQWTRKFLHKQSPPKTPPLCAKILTQFPKHVLVNPFAQPQKFVTQAQSRKPPAQAQFPQAPLLSFGDKYKFSNPPAALWKVTSAIPPNFRVSETTKAQFRGSANCAYKQSSSKLPASFGNLPASTISPNLRFDFGATHFANPSLPPMSNAGRHGQERRSLSFQPFSDATPPCSCFKETFSRPNSQPSSKTVPDGKWGCKALSAWHQIREPHGPISPSFFSAVWLDVHFFLFAEKLKQNHQQ